MKRIKKIVFVILSIFLGLLLIFNIYNFISIKVLHKDLASVNGYAMLEVVSGSMEPTILKGDIIIINTKEKNYKANDIITFRGKEGEFVTHRIKSIDNKTMITKGDNNNTEDDPIMMDSIVGKYVTKINGAGKILASFKNPLTLVMIFIIGLLGCVLLSTDSDGNPKFNEDEIEFQEFLKNKNAKEKNESSKTKEPKVKSSPKNKTNTTSKNDTNKEKNQTNNTKKDNSPKKEVKSSNSIKNNSKKSVPKKETTVDTKQTKNSKTVAKNNPKNIKTKATVKTNSKSKTGTTKKTTKKHK